MISKCPKEFNYFIDEIKVKRNLLAGLYINSQNKNFLSKDINLLENLDANKSGYFISKFLEKNLMEQLIQSTLNFLSKKFDSDINTNNFNEKFINMQDKFFHLKMKEIYKGINFDELPFSLEFVESWASILLKKKVKLFYLKEPSFLVRIVRPNSIDFNPPHRDIYINRLRNAVNCFMPIMGVNRNSTLPLIPKSHFWLESDTFRTDLNPIVDGLKFSVPAIIQMKDLSPLVLTRPNVDYGEVMFFSPYCIHGGGKNTSNETRMSFEFRFKLK
tara:strand:- start:2042 stop:2860 length:819 start_codon:yes stop_codon:yes gene_type:complete